MPQYEKYQRYQVEVDYIHLVELENMYHKTIENIKFYNPSWDPDAPQNRVAGGVRLPSGSAMKNEAVQYCMDTAIEAAKAQIKAHKIPMPEDEAITLRYPGTSPRGKYSVIDMKHAERWNDIGACAQFRSPELAEYVAAIRKSEFYKRLEHNVTAASYNHAYLSRAAKLCPDGEGQEILNAQARTMETHPSVLDMDRLMQGIEYLHSLRDTVPQDVGDLFRRELKIELNEGLRQKLSPRETAPGTLNIQFENFDDILAQRARSNPENWNKTPEELAKMAPSPQAVDRAVQPYAIASAHRTLKHAFAQTEKHGFDLRDLLIVNGKTLQEHFNDMGLPADLPPDAIQTRASALVTSALLSGKRVEAFLPDADGKLPVEPAPIRAAGQSPVRSEQPVVLSAWERFCSKLGFFKEKAAAAEEYRQAMAARDRALGSQLARRLERMGDQEGMERRFFGSLENEMRDLKATLPSNSPYRNVTRTSPTSTCICALAAEHRLEDILDSGKLLPEKQAIAREYINHAREGDAAWLGQKLAAGAIALEGQINRLHQATDMKDPVQRANMLPTLCAATYAGFDVYQDVTYSHNEPTMEAFSREMARLKGQAEMPPQDQLQQGKELLRRLLRADTAGRALSESYIARGNLMKSDFPALGQMTTHSAVPQMLIGDLTIKALDRSKPLHQCAIDTVLQTNFATKVKQCPEVAKLTQTILENSAAREALAKLAATTSMDELIKVDAAPLLTRARTGPELNEALDRVAGGVTATLTKSLDPVLKSSAQEKAPARRL